MCVCAASAGATWAHPTSLCAKSQCLRCLPAAGVVSCEKEASRSVVPAATAAVIRKIAPAANAPGNWLLLLLLLLPLRGSSPKAR